MMMKKMSLALALLATVVSVNGQNDYKQAIGVRLSSHVEYATIAASYKMFISEPGAIELNLGVGNRTYFGYKAPGVSFSGVYQHHFDIEAIEGLKWFIGGGAVAFNSRSRFNDYDGFGFGVFPTGGADYKFAKIPLNLSADFRPTFHVTSPNKYPNFYVHDVGVAARFTF